MPDSPGFTPHDQALWECIRSGWTVNEIAEELDISKKSAYEGIARLRSKLGLTRDGNLWQHALRNAKMARLEAPK